LPYCFIAFPLARKQIDFINRMIRSGRYNSQSEVVRAALRRLGADREKEQ
jgi:putative addiction module CopG family antidote